MHRRPQLLVHTFFAALAIALVCVACSPFLGMLTSIQGDLPLADTFGAVHLVVVRLGLVSTAVVLYLWRPASTEAWAFFGFTAALALSVEAGAPLEASRIASGAVPWLATAGVVLVGVIVHAYQDSIHKTEVDYVLSRIWTGITLASLPCSFALSTALMARESAGVPANVMQAFLWTYFALAAWTTFTGLFVAFRRARTVRQRARLRLLLWVWPLGAWLPAATHVVDDVLQIARLSPAWDGLLALLVVSLGYAVGRVDLIHLARSARRLLSSAAVIAIVGVCFGGAMLLVQRTFGELGAAGTVSVTVTLFALAAPVAQSLQRTIETLMRRVSARYDATRVLARFTNRCATAGTLEDLVHELDVALGASLGPKRFDLFRYEPRERRLRCVIDPDRTVPVDDILGPLVMAEGPTLLDEEVRSGLLADAVIAIPLSLRGEPVGLLLIDHASERSTYLASDVELAWGLAAALSIALVNSLGLDSITRENGDLSRRLAEKHQELEEKHRELAEKHRLLDEQHKTLVSLATAQGKTMASIGQDLRSPLSIMRQNLQTLERDFEEMAAGEARDMIAALRRQEERLSDLRERVHGVVTLGGASTRTADATADAANSPPATRTSAQRGLTLAAS